jgi:O-antigen ligase
VPDLEAAARKRSMTASALTPALGRLQELADRAGRWSAIALGFSIPISTALDGVLMALVLLAWLAAGRYRYKLEAVRANPVAVAALVLWLVTALGVLWAGDTGGDAGVYLGKYSRLLLLPVLVSLLTDPRDRQRALMAFAAGLLVTLALSYALWLGLLPPGKPFTAETASNATVFKKHIAQNTLMAFGMLLFAVFAWRAMPGRSRWLWIAAALLAAVNVLFMVYGRTGHVVLATLAAVAAAQLFRWRGVVAAAIAIPLALGALYSLSPAVQKRVDMGVSEAQRWKPDNAASDSVGLRLELYHYSLPILLEHALLGTGTGGFPKAYAQRAGDTVSHARNPHNQYLLTAIELGVVGLAALLFLLVQHGRASARLAVPDERLLARGLLALMAVGCLFNSQLLDHTEGVFFVWLSGVLFAAVPGKPQA